MVNANQFEGICATYFKHISNMFQTRFKHVNVRKCDDSALPSSYVSNDQIASPNTLETGWELSEIYLLSHSLALPIVAFSVKAVYTALLVLCKDNSGTRCQASGPAHD